MICTAIKNYASESIVVSIHMILNVIPKIIGRECVEVDDARFRWPVTTSLGVILISKWTYMSASTVRRSCPNFDRRNGFNKRRTFTLRSHSQEMTGKAAKIGTIVSTFWTNLASQAVAASTILVGASVLSFHGMYHWWSFAGKQYSLISSLNHSNSSAIGCDVISERTTFSPACCCPFLKTGKARVHLGDKVIQDEDCDGFPVVLAWRLSRYVVSYCLSATDWVFILRRLGDQEKYGATSPSHWAWSTQRLRPLPLFQIGQNNHREIRWRWHGPPAKFS